MPNGILRFEELSSPAIAALDKDKTAVFVPVSPVEGHGSHLPLGVDYFDALYFAEKAARLTIDKRPDFDALVYPGIPLGTQLYKQPGSVRIGGPTLYNIITGIGNSLALWGFKYVFLLSGHGSPRDIVALESACVKISGKHKIQMHNLSGALAIRFLKGEFIDKISGRLSRPLTKDEKAGASGSNPGYFGSPSKASAEFAEVSMEVLMDDVGSTIERCLSGEDVSRGTVSPLYNIKILRPKFKR
jgi:creatinine amidohydrolase